MSLKKVEAILNFKGKIHVIDWREALRLKNVLQALGELTVMEEMELDGILEMYEIEVDLAI